MITYKKKKYIFDLQAIQEFIFAKKDGKPNFNIETEKQEIWGTDEEEGSPLKVINKTTRELKETNVLHENINYETIKNFMDILLSLQSYKLCRFSPFTTYKFGVSLAFNTMLQNKLLIEIN